MKQKKKVTIFILVCFVMLNVLASLNTTVYGATTNKTITFKSKLVYDAVVSALNASGGTVVSTSDSTLQIVLSQTSISKVTSVNIRYYDNAKIDVDLSGIENFTSIKYFTIIGGSHNSGKMDNLKIVDLSPVGYLTNITELQLNEIVVMSGIDAIGKLNKLTSLSLSGIANFNTSIIANKTGLVTLKLYACDIDDNGVKNLAKLTNLKSLYLGDQNYAGNNITNISPLKTLVNLQVLSISNNQITDISVVKNFTALKELQMRSNKVQDLSPIANLKNLTILSLGRACYSGATEGNPIKSMDPVKNLNLSQLEASCCGITDISFLNSMSDANLWKLDLSGNHILDFSPVAKKKVENLNISQQKYEATIFPGGVVDLPQPMKNAFIAGTVEYDSTAKFSTSRCQVTNSYQVQVENKAGSSTYVQVYTQNRDGISGSTLNINVSTEMPAGYNGIWKSGNQLLYILDGEVCELATGIVEYGGPWVWWWFDKGRQAVDFYGFKEANGTWLSIAAGKVEFGYYGLKYDQNLGWWYVENGSLIPTYNGLVEYDGNWWCVAGGQVAFGYTGLWYDENVGWWYVRNGMIDFSYNGLIEYNGAWWCVAGGRVAFEYTGLWYDANVGWWYVRNGMIDFNYNGLIEYNGAWWCVAEGRVAFEYTGLWYDAYVGWWYVENGAINFAYIGNIAYLGSVYKVHGGQVIF